MAAVAGSPRAGLDRDLLRRQGLPRGTRMVRREAGPRQEGFDTALSAAVAGGTRPFAGRHGGQGVVAPFAGDRVGARQRPAAGHDAAADAGAENRPEDEVVPGRRAVGRFRQGEAVGVVGKAHRPGEQGREIGVHGPADQPDRVGVLDQAGRGREGSRNADADRAATAEPGLGAVSQIGDRAQSRAVVAPGRRDAFAQNGGAGFVEGGDLDLGAAEIDADPERHDTIPIVRRPPHGWPTCKRYD